MQGSHCMTYQGLKFYFPANRSVATTAFGLEHFAAHGAFRYNASSQGTLQDDPFSCHLESVDGNWQRQPEMPAHVVAFEWVINRLGWEFRIVTLGSNNRRATANII